MKVVNACVSTLIGAAVATSLSLLFGPHALLQSGVGACIGGVLGAILYDPKGFLRTPFSSGRAAIFVSVIAGLVLCDVCGMYRQNILLNVDLLFEVGLSMFFSFGAIMMLCIGRESLVIGRGFP